MGYLKTTIALAVLCATPLLSGCATKPAYVHYDECSAETATFRDMVVCGKRKRTAYCQKEGACTDLGNSFVQYADALAQQVAAKEISEGEARRRYAEYKTQQIQHVQQVTATEDIAVAASLPKTCSGGPFIVCY